MRLLKFLLLSIFVFTSINSFAHAQDSNPSEIFSNQALNPGQTHEISGSYILLANTYFTPELTVYKYKKRLIKIITRDNSQNIRFSVSLDDKKYSNRKIATKHLPWWKKSAPKILKELNFTKVNGLQELYDLGQGYSLRLLPNQGNWGKVYVLEKKHATKPQIICAVKLLLTRDDRKKERKEFLERHRIEIANTLKIARWPLAAKPYGIIKNDADHYLIFLEYGQNAKKSFTEQNLTKTLKQIATLMKNVNKMHHMGYAHGDLKIENMLIRRNKIKLCDWFSLQKLDHTMAKDYLYIGDHLPPEAIRAFYFKNHGEQFYKYPLIAENSTQAYWLHPIAADRFCLGFSLLQILAKDLYDKLQTVFHDLNPYSPKSLDFWPKYAHLLTEVQIELNKRAIEANINNKLLAQILHQVKQFLSLNPLERTIILQQA